MRSQCLLFLAVVAAATPAISHPLQQPLAAGQVTPAAERRAPPHGAPSQTLRVSVDPLGQLDLRGEIKTWKARMLRTRRITIAPGGSVAWHEHEGRPGVAYVLNGTLIEVRDDGSGLRTIKRVAGEAVYELSGVRHGWRNESAEPAEAVVVDLVTANETEENSTQQKDNGYVNTGRHWVDGRQVVRFW